MTFIVGCHVTINRPALSKVPIHGPLHWRTRSDLSDTKSGQIRLSERNALLYRLIVEARILSHDKTLIPQVGVAKATPIFLHTARVIRDHP